ncbi:MAG: mucoidy inhibitor MuiA family protein [Candidatus Cloacimonetes bacterium]|nr:mucoidy inhibitor MuiA family protein [Candidatus Cloacimonadota bacterium]
MKNIIIPVLLFFCFTLLTALDSNITNVTVFSDRAQITRSAASNLSQGEHLLIFNDLPVQIEKNSIQVSGKGNAILRDVKFKTEQFTHETDVQQRVLLANLQEFIDKKIKLNDQVAQAHTEKQIIKDILTKLTSTKEHTESIELDPDKWIKMVEFHRTRNTALDSEIRITNKQLAEINSEIDKIQREIQELGQKAYKHKNIVEVLVEMKQAGELKLKLSYIVYGPYWTPLYDLRVDSQNKTIALTYKSNIYQSTGEDWNEVDLKLSSAKPNINAQPPKLHPLCISLFKPQAVLAESKKSYSRNLMKSGSEYPMADAAALGDKEMYDTLQEMTSAPSIVETGATAVVFDIEGNYSIKSDNKLHQATITIENFPAEFSYTAIPKYSQFTYLKAKIKNDSEYPFLAGDSNVFLDNNFVANSYLENVAPSEEFWSFLGIDEAVKIEYKFVKKYDETGGLFVEKNKRNFEYLITITNNKKTSEEIVLWDQLPISQNENLKVKLLEPAYKEDTKELKINEFKYLEWRIELKPNEEKKIPFRYSVEYPKGTQLRGF